jgi:hypothetical protein
MKGPDRPHTMQTIGPPLARPAGGATTAVAALSPDSDEYDSGKVDTPTWSGED